MSAVAGVREEAARLRNTVGSRRRYASRRAWLRASLDRHLLRYNLEHCHRCGRRVSLIWWSVVGWTNVVRDRGCLRCIRCFDREAQAAGVWISWLAVSHDEWDQRVRAYFKEKRDGA
jgi:hypothetical protein